MTERDHASDAPSVDHDDARPQLARWARVALVASVVLMIVGGACYGFATLTASDAPPPAASGAGTAPGVASGFAAGGAAPDTPAAANTAEGSDLLDRWSPVVFRLGFSFFVGFAIAYALRTFIKASLITIGLLLLALFGLQYAGVVDVNWSAMESHYDTVVSWLRTQTESFGRFVRGYLPSGASAGLGLVAGFRRKVL